MAEMVFGGKQSRDSRKINSTNPFYGAYTNLKQSRDSRKVSVAW